MCQVFCGLFENFTYEKTLLASLKWNLAFHYFCKVFSSSCVVLHMHTVYSACISKQYWGKRHNYRIQTRMIGTVSFIVSNLRKGDFHLRSNWRLQSTGVNHILAEKWAVYSSLIYSDTPDFLYFFFLRSPVEFFFFLVDPVSLAIL